MEPALPREKNASSSFRLFIWHSQKFLRSFKIYKNHYINANTTSVGGTMLPGFLQRAAFANPHRAGFRVDGLKRIICIIKSKEGVMVGHPFHRADGRTAHRLEDAPEHIEKHTVEGSCYG